MVTSENLSALFGQEVQVDWDSALEEWLGTFENDRTRRTYRRAWDSFREMAQKPIGAVTAEDVTKWMEEMQEAGASPSVINQRLSALSSFYNSMKIFNPVDSVDRPPVPRDPQKVDLYRIKRYLRAIGADDESDGSND